MGEISPLVADLLTRVDPAFILAPRCFCFPRHRKILLGPPPPFSGRYAAALKDFLRCVVRG